MRVQKPLRNGKYLSKRIEMEKTFLEKKLTDNANQDPMGNDAHQGLERFLDKFH